MSLQGKILDARKSKGLTQEELAERSKLTVRTIQRIESGETVPRPFTLKALAAALEIPFEEINPAKNPETVSADSTKAIDADLVEAKDFLHTLCLSSFSYLVVPFVHFLIPNYLLKKAPISDTGVLAFGKKLIRQQITWTISLHALLLLTVCYNLILARKTSFVHINYLIPVAGMYFINAVFLVAKIRTIKDSLPQTTTSLTQ